MSPVPKNFVGEPLCIPKNFWYRKKIYAQEGEREGGRAGGREGGSEGTSRFLVKNFCLTVPKNFLDFLCVFQKYSVMQKKLAIREEVSITIFRQSVLSRSTESFRRGTLLCFRKFWLSKNFLLKVMSRFPIENLLSHSTEKFRSGALLCFKNFLVSKNVMDERGRQE